MLPNAAVTSAITLFEKTGFRVKKNPLVSDGAICLLFFVHSSLVRGARGQYSKEKGFDHSNSD